MKTYQFFATLVALQLFKSFLACPTGCITCNSQNICQECEQNFQLDQESGVCIFIGCPQYLYFQNKSNQQPGVCQAICDQGYQGDIKTNLCDNLSQCSLTYSSQTGISQVGENIKLILPNQDQYFIIVYSTYITFQLKSTGRFEQTIPFQQNLEYVEYFQDNFYIFQNDNKVARWNIQNNSTELFNFALLDQNNNLNTQNYSNQNYCQELNSVSILQVLSLNDKQNIIILNDQAQYLVLEQNSCQIYQIPQLCSQVKIAPSSTLSLYFLQLQTIIFVLNTDLSQYYLKPFQRKITDMQSSVSAIDTNDLNNLATFCSNSGQIMTWDYSTIIKPKLIDSTIINNQGSCQSIQFLVNNQALILFQNSIVALDVIHSKILNTWNFINPLSKMINRFILPQNGISYLLYDSCFKAFDQSYQIIFIDCNPLFDDIIIQAKLDPSMNLVVQKAYSFSVFQVLSNKLNLLATYTSQAQIQIWKIRNFPQDYQQKNQITFEIVSYFSDQSFTIFSQDLKPIVSYQNIQISTAIDINFVSDDPNDNLYVVGGINSQKSASYKYQAFALFKNYTNIFQVTQQNGFNKLFPIYKDINQGNGAIAYTYKVVVNLSYLTVVQSFYYNMLNQDNFYSTNYLSQNVFMNVFQTIKNDQFFMFGDQYGLMTVDATRRKVYTNVYNLNSKDIQSKDFIKGVYQSLILQKFFIIKSNIQVYKLLTNEFIEILEVQLDPSQPVQYFSILESQNIIICIKKNILFVKNYQTNKVYYYTNFSQITNYLVDNNNIYLYGSNLSMLGLDLTEKYSQNNNLDHSIVQQCAFSSIGLVCKKASATIMIFDKNNLNLINTLQQRFLDNNYLFQIDNLYQRIFLYSSNIEIYSFNGNFQKYISSISSQISALQVFTNDISITSTSIFIYDRKSLNYRGVIISPGGGTILSTGYIPELNHLVFYLSVIRFAQIFTINLDNLLTFMSYKNPFTQNQPSVSAGYAYDKDQNLFILLDLTGSLQTIDYQGQFVSWTTTKFVEYDQYSTYSFQGFSLDFQNNNLLVYSQTQVFNLCYGDLTNQVIQFRTNKKQLFAEIADTSSNSLDQTSLSFIVAGDEGLLYKYQNTAFEYFYQLNEEIQSIQYNSNLKLLIIALSQSFVIFNNFDQNSFSNLNLQQNQQQVIPLNNYFSSFICDDVFITKDGLISHYDFANKIVWSTIQLQDPLSRIVKKICSSTTPNIYLGLNNGDLIIYNRNTYQQLTVNLVAKQQGQQYFGLEIGYLVETSTDLWACFSNTQGVFRINLQNQIFQQIIQFDNLNTYKTFQQLNVMIFDVDEQNNRFFLNFIGEKVLRVFDLSGNFLQIISLSGVMYNNIQINSLHILAYTTFHVMIYDRITLQYIQRIRRDNHNDFIVEVIEINSQYIVLLSQSKYEIFQINQNLIEATLMDQVQLQNPIFMNYAINQNNNQNIDQIMQVLLLSQNQVLEQKYNLIYEATQALDKICSMDVSVSTFYDISLSMSKIKPVSFPDPSQRTVIPVTDSSLNNYWNILLNVNDLRNINFQSTLNSLTQVYPIQVSQVSNNQELISLQIYSDSFSSYEKQEVQIRDFKFVFENNLGQITFYDYSQNVTLNNIQIEQQVTDNITFQFANMRQIVFDQIYLKNVSRKFNQNVSDQNYFFDFEYVDYVYIYNLVLDSSNLLNMSFSGLISAQNVQYMTIQNLTIQNSNIYSLIRIQQVENLSIQNLKIINCSNASNKLSEYVLNIIGVTNSTLSNIFISQNFNLQFIYTSNIFQQNGTQYIQQTDILSINSLYTVQNQISFSNSSSLISVQSSFCNIIFDNDAQLYGKNVGTYLQNSTIGVIQGNPSNVSDISQSDSLNIDYKIIQNEEMKQADQVKFQQILQIFQFQSGGMLNLFVKLIDSEGTYLKFSVQKYYSLEYPDSILAELALIQFKIQSYTLSQDILINGHNIIASSDFDDQNNYFVFTQIQISSMPNQTTSLLIVPSYLPTNIYVLPIYIEIHMRICYPGEIVKQLENNIYSCYSCPLGSYSMTDPTKDQLWYEYIQNTPYNINDQSNQQNVYQSECQKCPDSAFVCQNKTIVLKTGYWRKNSTSTDIVQCSSLFNACDDQDYSSKQGCLQGYMGPVCRVCDVSGDPNTQVIVSMNCVVSLDYIKQYGQVHVIQVLQAFLPLLFLIALLPDQINFFSKQLTCTQVGSERYVTSDLTIQCEDPNYNSFTYPLSIPLIIIWSLFPFIIFKRLQKRSNQLQRCFTLYYFGYYYQEFKEKFYYWEFIRIYLRVIIVVAFTLTSQSQFISYQIVIFILFVYIKFTLYFNPIKNNNLQRFDLFCYQIIILNSLLSTINTEIQSSAISGIIYSLHSVFIFMIVLAIIFFKLNNPLTYIGKCFNKLLSFILPQSVYRRYLKNQGVNWRIYTLWKKIQKNLNLIVQLQAIEKVTQEKSQLKQNQVSQTFDTMLNIKNNDIKQKISLINQVQRSYIHEHSRYKDQTEEIDFIKFGKTSSENSKNNEIQILKDNKSDFDDQIFNDDQSQQTGQIDEINFQSDIYKSNVLRNTLDLNYETKFKLKNSLDFQSKKSFNQTVIQLFKQSLACPRGCNQCNSQNTCYKCEQDFQLDYKLGVCIFNGCQQYLYFQEKDKYQPGVCQSICDQGYQGDDVTNLCINLNKCSLTFNTQTGINQVDENINLVLPYQDLYFVLVYSSYISIQLKQTGVFQQSIPFNQNIQNVQYYQGSFYIFQNDKKVVRWNFEKNNTELFDFALQGSLNQRIQINSLKRDFGIVITQDRKNSKIYATLLLDLNQKSFVQHLSIIQLNSLNNEKYFFFNDIVLITTPQGIQILQFIIDDQNNLKTQSYSNGYQCQNLNDITIQQVLQLDNQQYLVIINDQKFYLVIDQSQCQVFQIPQVCTQIKIASASTFSFYFLQLQNIILVMNYSLSQALQIQMQANIVDFLTISSTTDLNMILAALDSQSNLSFFSFNQKNFGYQQLNQYKLNTFNPTNLVLINQITDKNSQQKQIQIFAYSKQLQSVTFNMTSGSQLTFIQQYFLKPFQRKVIGMQSSVTSIDVNDTNNLVTFCSINGQIMTWDISILIKPKLVDSTFLINQGSCKQIQYLVNNYALILFQNSIIAFDVIYSKLLNTWNFVNQSSKMTNRFILPVNGISFLLYDSCFKSFDQNFELIFQDCNPFFDDIIIEAKLDKSMNLIVQKIYSFSVFKVLTNQLNLSATYTSIAQIQIWKIRNFPQSYQQANKITFEIVSYFSDQSFTIFSQDLNPIKSYSNIPISVALDISFITDDPNDNLYVVGGFTNQNSIDYKYKAFALFKNYTNVFQVIQQSAFNYFFPIYKNFNNQNHSLGYNFKAVVLLNQQTMIQTFYYNMQSQDNFFSSNYLSQNVLANNFLLLKQNQFFILGDQNGLMAVDVARKEIYTKVYSLNQTELTQRDFIQGVQQSLKSQRQSKIPLNQFSTFQYQNNSNNLYLYGSIISILSFDLTEKFSLNNYSDKSIFSMCTLSQIGLICKNKSGTIMTLDKSNLNLITTMQQRFLDINYRFQIDAFYQRIFLYSSNIEVYSFNGNFLMYISSINFYISSLQIFTNDISVTSTSIKIYDRKTLNFRGEIQSPGGATILNTGYIPELNQLVFYVSVIRFAQIFTINLDNLIQVMQYKNQFTQNQPSVCASYEYDKDQNLFILLDQTGNFQTIDYQGQYTSWTTTKFVEYDQYSTYSFTGFSLDFQNNNLLVYSQTQVFNLCYGDLTNQVIQFRANKKQLFVQIADTNLSSQNSTKVAFIIAADQGLLYKYQNTAFEYFYQLNEEIQSIKYNSNLKLLIIALSQTLVIFNEFNQNSLINFNPWQIQQQNIALKSFFSSFICDDLIITKDGVINHYDFINKITLGKIKLQDPLSRIIKKICSSITPNIYLGLNNGDLIIYNRNTYQQFTISLVAKQQGQQYFGLEIGYLVETSTDVWACFSNTQGVFRINLSNQSFQQIIQFDNLNTYKTIQQLNVMVFDVDEQNNRFFLNFIGEKVLRVYDLSGNLLQIISLPGIMYNNMQINSLHILAYTTFHVMIYDRISLQYIQRIRRDNHNDFIVEVIEINSQYIVLLSQSKYEIFQIKQNQIEAALMDQVQLQNPIFMNYVINQNNNQNIDQIMQVLLLSQNQVLEQKYNLIYEATQAQDKICSMDVSVSTFYDISLSMSKIKPVSFPDPSQRSIIPVTDSSLNNYWNILLNVSDIRSINFQSTMNSLTKVYPIQKSQVSNNQELNSLQIFSDSFSSYKKQQVQIRDFKFIFQNQLDLINFHKSSTHIQFQNIQIMQQLIDNISLQFIDMKKVVFNQIYLKNLQRKFNQISNNDTGFLFSFRNLDQVNIYNLVLDNSKLQNLSFSGLISIFNVKNLTIQNLIIQNSNIYHLISIQQVQNLSINNLTIVNCSNAFNNLNEYVLNIIGVTNSTLSNIFIFQNINLLFIQTSNIFEQNGIQYIQQTDILNIYSLYTALNQISYSNSQSLISIQSTFCQFNNITYQNNQGNLLISFSQNVLIQNSLFQNNTCLNGGALSLIRCSNTIKIKNSKFQYNQAFASGGAIYLENIDAQIQLQSQVQIIKNQALIGGGIRLLNNKPDLFQSLNFNYKNIIFDNNAQLYGKNVGTFLQNATIGVIQGSSSQISDSSLSNSLKVDYKIIQNQEMKKPDQEKFQQILQIFQFQSGSVLNLFLQLIDTEGTYLKFSIQKYYSQEYPEPVMTELKQIQFKIQSYTQTQDVLINGHNIITSSDFDDKNNQFVFTQIQISSMPNSTTYLQIIPYYTPASIDVLPIYIEIQLRICYPGEILKQLESSVYSCYNCPLGSYSMTDPTQDQFWFENISKNQTKELNKQQQVYQSECKKCPDSAAVCQKSIIILKRGYWRTNRTSIDIVECQTQFNACDEQDESSQDGCLRGYIGPVCKMCDVEGKLWKGQRFSQSNLGQYNCQQCNDTKYQIFIIILAFFLLILYFIFSMLIFFNSFVHSCVCYYLRQINLISISRNSIKDKSSFYMKILVNYVKISSILVSLQASFLPDLLPSFSDYISDPISKITININCLISSNYFRQYSQAHITQVIQLLIIITIFLVLFVIIFLFEKLKILGIQKYHKFTLMNIILIFFQPDQINFFSKQLTCDRVGSELYVASDYMIKCNNLNYNQFTYPLSIPLIMIWSFFPLIIFKRLQKKKNELQKCLTLYYFGYYYQEFKEKFYYWEFIRIYLRVIIIVAFSITQQSKFISYQIVIFILFIYIKFTLYYNPIRNNNLQRFDLFCYQIIILNSLLSIININIQSGIISGMIYTLHLSLILMIIIIITFFKLNNPFTFIGKYFGKFLYCILPSCIYNKYLKIYSSNWQILTRWKKIQKNLKLIVSLQAIEKVTQQKRQFNSNQVKIDLDSLIKEKSDNIKMKISNMNKQSPKRSILFELSKFKDQKKVFKEKEQSEISSKKILDVINLQKKESSNQILEDIILQQGISDELEYKSEVFTANELKKTVDQNYQAIFNRQKNNNSYQQFKQKTAKYIKS
ncbi:hypothetical protein ABPG74_003545 [Tetrahymena malaccensis]